MEMSTTNRRIMNRRYVDGATSSVSESAAAGPREHVHLNAYLKGYYVVFTVPLDALVQFFYDDANEVSAKIVGLSVDKARRFRTVRDEMLTSREALRRHVECVPLSKLSYTLKNVLLHIGCWDVYDEDFLVEEEYNRNPLFRSAVDADLSEQLLMMKAEALGAEKTTFEWPDEDNYEAVFKGKTPEGVYIFKTDCYFDSASTGQSLHVRVVHYDPANGGRLTVVLEDPCSGKTVERSVYTVPLWDLLGQDKAIRSIEEPAVQALASSVFRALVDFLLAKSGH